MRLAVVLMAMAVSGQVLAREWSDASGKFKVEAELVAVKSGKVVLEKPDGTFLSIPVEKLSKADQDFLKTKPGEGSGEPSPLEASTDPRASSADRAKMVKISVRPNQEGKAGEVRRFPDQGWGIKSLAFSPNGGILAAGKNDRALQLFDVNEEARLDFQDKLEFLGSVSACAFSPDGTKLLVGGDKGMIQLYDVTNQNRLKPLGQFAGHAGEVKCIALSGDGRIVASGGEDKRLRIWKLDDGREVASQEGFEGKIKAVFVTADGKTAYGTDGALLLGVDIAKNEIAGRAMLTGSWAAGQSAAFSPDGKWVAAGDSYKVRLWSLKTGKEQPSFEEREIQWSAAFTPDGTRLITGAAGRINVWDVAKQSRIVSIPTEGTGYIQTLAASPDNLHVAAIPSSAGQTLQVLRIPEAGQ